MHDHLPRLRWIWTSHPVYMITTCAAHRLPVLANAPAHEVLLDEWRGLEPRYGWAVGRYVVMPDHVHFFCTAINGGKVPLPLAMGKWKEWTAKRLKAGTLWEEQYFDHLLRSAESRERKWNYVRQNPVRAGLVSRVDDWPYAGHVHFL